MNNDEISNPKLEVTKGIALNEKDYLDSLLSTLKSLSKNYVISMTEASNETLYQKYFDSFVQISNLQRETYELMFKFGWYKLEKQKINKIKEKENMLNQELMDLNW